MKLGIEILFFARKPVVAAGVKAVLSGVEGFRLADWCESVPAAVARLGGDPPDILLVHLTPRTTLTEIAQLRAAASDCRIVLWGETPGGDFAFQAMQLGVRGILSDDLPAGCLLTSLENVQAGVLCFDKLFVDEVMARERIELTERQGQIVSLVARGLKNKVIAKHLGITEGTVKVYLYKLYKKLGIKDRLELALYGLETLSCSVEHAPSEEPAGDVFSPRSLPAQSRTVAQFHRIQ